MSSYIYYWKLLRTVIAASALKAGSNNNPHRANVYVLRLNVSIILAYIMYSYRCLRLFISTENFITIAPKPYKHRNSCECTAVWQIARGGTYSTSCQSIELVPGVLKPYVYHEESIETVIEPNNCSFSRFSLNYKWRHIKEPKRNASIMHEK